MSSGTWSRTLGSSRIHVLSAVRASLMELAWNNTDGSISSTGHIGIFLFGSSLVHVLSGWIYDLNLRCPAAGCKEAFRHKGHLKSHKASFHPEVDQILFSFVWSWNSCCFVDIYILIQRLWMRKESRGLTATYATESKSLRKYKFSLSTCLQVCLQVCTRNPPGVAPAGGEGSYKEQSWGGRGEGGRASRKIFFLPIGQKKFYNWFTWFWQ